MQERLKVNRRRLLQSAPAVLAGTALHTSAAPTQAQLSSASATPSFIVRSGESRSGTPWTIGGDPHVWSKISAADVSGRLAVLEVTTPPKAGPPMHIHLAQNEWMYIMQGSFGLQCGSERVILKAGDSFMAPMQIPHAYVVLGAGPAKHLNIYDPAGEVEAFFANYDHEHGPNAPQNPPATAAANPYHMKVVGPPLKADSFSS